MAAMTSSANTLYSSKLINTPEFSQLLRNLLYLKPSVPDYLRKGIPSIALNVWVEAKKKSFESIQLPIHCI